MVGFGAKYGLTCKQVRTQIVNTRRKRMMKKKHMGNVLAIDWWLMNVLSDSFFWDNISQIKQKQRIFHATKDLAQTLVCYVRLIFMGEIKMSN